MGNPSCIRYHHSSVWNRLKCTVPFISAPAVVLCDSQIDEQLLAWKPERPGRTMNVRSDRSIPCLECHGWFDASRICDLCESLRRRVSCCWSLQLDTVRITLHRQLSAGRGRERRGKIELSGVAPEIGFALLDFFAWPDAAENRDGPIYKEGHPTYRQVTNKSGSAHMIQFTYQDMMHVNWAFPLHDMFPATSYGACRFVSANKFTDVRAAGTPTRFRYKWAAPSAMGGIGRGTHTFSIHFNITHINGHDGHARFNISYNRWTAEMQQQLVQHIKQGIRLWPSRPLRATHTLHNQTHPLLGWAKTPTLISEAPFPQTTASKSAAAESQEFDSDSESDSDAEEFAA